MPAIVTLRIVLHYLVAVGKGAEGMHHRVLHLQMQATWTFLGNSTLSHRVSVLRTEDPLLRSTTGGSSHD